MNKSYKRKLWKRAGIVLVALFTTSAVCLALYEFQLLQTCAQEKHSLEAQIANYIQEEAEAKEQAAYADDVREVYMEEVELAEHLTTGDRIDIRIRYSNAEDYLILSDKLLVRSDSAKGMILQLTEEEILMISSAITDCADYENTKVYAVEYPKDLPLDAGTVNYIAGYEILVMLGREITEGESRAALEQRLAGEKQ